MYQKCDKGWHYGSCCCNCKSHHKDSNGWVCRISIKGENPVVYRNWGAHGICELHDPIDNDSITRNAIEEAIKATLVVENKESIHYAVDKIMILLNSNKTDGLERGILLISFREYLKKKNKGISSFDFSDIDDFINQQSIATERR